MNRKTPVQAAPSAAEGRFGGEGGGVSGGGGGSPADTPWPDWCLTAAQMRAAEAAAMEAGRCTGAELMDRAARECLAALEGHWPDLAATPGRALVLCGPGNNGGDGYLVACLLRQRGWQVRVQALAAPGDSAPDARAARARWQAEGGAVEALDASQLPSAAGQVDLVVEALFGAGLSRPLEPALAQALQAIEGPRRMAIDAPAGLCMDSGRPLGRGAFRADLTVSFHAVRPGHLLAEGPAHCGALALRGIGLPPLRDGAARLVGRPPAAALAKGAGHKFDHGHALVLSGGPGRTGAARLAARAALRIGAGLVTLAVPPAAQLEAATHSTAVMLTRVGDAEGLRARLEDRRITALCLGPGLGTGAAQAELVAAALADGRPAVLDADALTLMAQDAGLAQRLHARCVLTPHMGEFARLFPDLAAKLQGAAEAGPAYSALDAARAAAGRCGATLLLKGPATVIAAPDGGAAIHAGVLARAAPWLATAGAGDVLAGLIAGLMARGAAPAQAAELAAWLHVEAARAFGPGLIAEDLPEALPGVLRALV